jgi:SEC-C motif-containing protein
MEVLEVKDGGEDDTEGFVDFKAYYTIAGEDITHHEVASFRKEDGEWFFVDGIEVKPRPNKRLEKKRSGPTSRVPAAAARSTRSAAARWAQREEDRRGTPARL